jgi:gas vesicle protein
MKTLKQRFIPLLLTMIFLTGCFGAKSPQDVTQAFWKAVITQKVDDVIEYSTLVDAKTYTAFNKNWIGYQPVIGKILIDGNKAQIETTLSQINNTDKNHLTIYTYLVKQNEQWKVDFVRTAESFDNDALGNIMGQLNILGTKLSNVLKESSEKFNIEMQRVENELKRFSNTVNEDANKIINQYSKELKKGIEELSNSIDRALKEHNKDLTDDDKKSLISVSENLGKSQQILSEPTLNNINKTSYQMRQTQQQLDNINNEKLSDYKNEWHELQFNFERKMQYLLDALSAKQ